MESTPADVALVKAAFERNGFARSSAQLTWQYLHNPTGKLFVDFAIPSTDTARVAAIYSVMPVFVRLNGQVVLGTQSLDTLTDVDFRGKGLFTKMALNVFSRCERNGVACVYGFPNGSSAPGFFKKLGWARLDPVPFLVRPLRANFILRRLGPLKALAERLPTIPVSRLGRPTLPRSHEIRPITHFDERIDGLWDRFAQGIGAAVHRDARYLSWRLFAKPETHYRVLGLYENSRLIAFCAFAAHDKHGGRVGYVLELLHEPGRADDAQRLLQECTADLADDGAEVVLAWCLDHSPNFRAYSTNGFFHLPERLRPIELHVGVRPLCAPPEANLGNRRNWYLSYLDSDTV